MIDNHEKFTFGKIYNWVWVEKIENDIFTANSQQLSERLLGLGKDTFKLFAAVAEFFSEGEGIRGEKGKGKRESKAAVNVCVCVCVFLYLFFSFNEIKPVTAVLFSTFSSLY